MSEAGGARPRRRILVTGASGKIGTAVVRNLLRSGYDVRATTSGRHVPEGANKSVAWIGKNFNEDIDFEREVEGCDAVIHLAAEMSDIARMQRVNVDATAMLARAAERARVKEFIYTSSVAVYGNTWSWQVTEASPTLTAESDIRSEYAAPDALRTYGRTKLLGEMALRRTAGATNYVVLRPTVVVDTDDVLAIGNWSKLRRSLLARRHAHHVHLEDVADAVLWLLERGLARDEPRGDVSVYNVAEDDFGIRSYEDVYRELYAMTGDTRYVVHPAPAFVDRLVGAMRTGLAARRVPFGRMTFSSDKLRSQGYRRRCGLSELYGSLSAAHVRSGAAHYRPVGTPS